MEIQLGQLLPNGVRVIIGFIILCNAQFIPFSLEAFRHYFYIYQKYGMKEGRGYFYFTKRSRSVALMDQPTIVQEWKQFFVFVKHPSFKTQGVIFSWNSINHFSIAYHLYQEDDARARIVARLNAMNFVLSI